MKNKSDELADRFVDFASNIIRFVIGLEKTAIGRHIGGQLARSAASAGANYEEARSAESRADFIHKMQIVLKELRESLYWMRLIEKANLIQSSNLVSLRQEASELANIVAKSIVTAKSRK
jgi:four helix bundle protein